MTHKNPIKLVYYLKEELNMMIYFFIVDLY